MAPHTQSTHDARAAIALLPILVSYWSDPKQFHFYWFAKCKNWFSAKTDRPNDFLINDDFAHAQAT
jgi:hypothetical protein